MQIGFNLPNSGPLSAVATMAEIASAGEAEKKIREIYRVLYSREPSADEIAVGVQFVQDEKAKGPAMPPRGALTPWEKYAQVLLAANEFVFID